MSKTYGEMTEAEIRREMGSPEATAAQVAGALWRPSEYTAGALTLLGDSDTEDGCCTVGTAGGIVYRHYAGDGYDTGVVVTLAATRPGGTAVAVTASVTVTGDAGPAPAAP